MCEEKEFTLKPEFYNQQEWYEMYIKLLKKYRQNYNTIKEAREYVKSKMEIRKKCENIYSYDIRNDYYIKQVNELLEILDKEDKDE